MIRAIAIDDEPKALEIIQNHAARISFLQIQEIFTNPFTALEYLNHASIDLIFLDINMRDISGLDLLNAIDKGKFLIIFTTAHSEFALQSYEVEALDYLLKPFDFSRFLRSVVKAQDKLSIRGNVNKDFFFVSTGNQQRKISFNDVLYIKGSGNYVTYHRDTEKIVVRSTIKETLSLLPPQIFVQVHRSYIIALNKLEKITTTMLLLDDKEFL